MILPRYATRGEMGIYKGVLGVDSEGQRVFFPNSYHREGLSNSMRSVLIPQLIIFRPRFSTHKVTKGILSSTLQAILDHALIFTRGQLCK